MYIELFNSNKSDIKLLFEDINENLIDVSITNINKNE